jgi:hypothetical protein
MPGTRVRPKAGPSTCPVPGIHVFTTCDQDVDGRDIRVRKHAVPWTAMPGHDEESNVRLLKPSLLDNDGVARAPYKMTMPAKRGMV